MVMGIVSSTQVSPVELCSTLTHFWSCSPRQVINFMLTWACHQFEPIYSLWGDAGRGLNLGASVGGSILACYYYPLHLATVFPESISKIGCKPVQFAFYKNVRNFGGVCCRLKSCWLNCSNVGSKDKQAVFRLWWVKNLDLSSQLLQTFIILMYWASIREKSFSRREVSVFKCMVHSECVFSAPKISTLKRPLAIALFFIFLKKKHCVFLSQLISLLGFQNPFRVYWLLYSPSSFLSWRLIHWNFYGMLFFFSWCFWQPKRTGVFLFFRRRHFCASVLNCLWFKEQGTTLLEIIVFLCGCSAKG